MIRNLMGIMIGLLFAIWAFLTNSNVIKIIMAIIATIVLVIVILWIIGYTSMRKEEKQNNKK